MSFNTHARKWASQTSDVRPNMSASLQSILDTDSEDEMPPGWEERVTVEGRVYYAK